MNKLKYRVKINCNTCGCSMIRIKTIKVVSSIKEQAIKEAKTAEKKWHKSIVGQNCKVCQSIIDDVNEEV